MSHIIRDSFKSYATIADAAQNMWSTVNAGGGMGFALGGRYVTDNQCVSCNSNATTTMLNVVSASNDQTCFAFFSWMFNASFSGSTSTFNFQLIDGATVQCSVSFGANGTITVYRGAPGGTVVATFVSAYSQQQWNGWNIKIVISSTVGEVHIRKNGSATDTFVATGLNLQTTANAYAQTYQLSQTAVSGAAVPMLLQDVWFYNGTGGAPNTFLANDVRTFWQSPNGPSQTQFTPSGNPLQTLFNTTTAVTCSANTEYAYPFAPNNNGPLASIAVNYNGAATGSVIMGLYDNTGPGGGPGNLLATSNTIVNPVLGVNTFTFASPPTVSNKSGYYIAILGNVNSVLKSNNVLTPVYSVAQTFGSGFTNPGNMTSGTNLNPWIQIAWAQANYTNVSDQTEDGTQSTVQSSTVGQEDRYTIPALPAVPSVIYGVQVRGFMQKSDSGARTAAMTITSGGTNVVGPTVALATTLENVVQQQDTDPNTGLAWTPLGVAAALPGMKVAA